MLKGYYFEDFKEGDEFLTPGRTVTEGDVMLFAGLSGDYNVLHTNADKAKETIFGGPIAHGLLGLSIVTGLKQRLGIFEGTVIAFLGLTWSFKAPIKFGDTIYVKVTIAEKRETSKPERGVLIQDIKLLNQHGEIVQEGQHSVMVKRKVKG